MSRAADRRATLPGASELFRTTGRGGAQPEPVPDPVEEIPAPAPAGPRGLTAVGTRRAARTGPSGRERHDEKITVYVSAEELLALETARLRLRAEHGIAVDRGRLVREAVAELLADLDRSGADALVVRRLSEEQGRPAPR